MSEETVFSEPTENPSEKKTPVAATQDEVDKLKERGLDELAKGKAHADRFIDFLEEQNKSLKEELDTRLTAAQTLEEIKNRAPEKTEVSEEPTSSGLKPEDIDTLVDKRISESRRQETVDANIAEADAKIKSIYGDKAESFMEEKCRELGLSKADFGEMAAKSPRAFFDLVGVTPKKGDETPAPTVGTINADALAIHSPGDGFTPGTHKWYNEQRKKDKAKFYSPEVQRRLFKDRERLGEDFYK